MVGDGRGFRKMRGIQEGESGDARRGQSQLQRQKRVLCAAEIEHNASAHSVREEVASKKTAGVTKP